MKKIILLWALALSITACTVLKTSNEIVLNDGTKVGVAVSVEEKVTTESSIEVTSNGGF